MNPPVDRVEMLYYQHNIRFASTTYNSVFIVYQKLIPDHIVSFFLAQYHHCLGSRGSFGLHSSFGQTYSTSERRLIFPNTHFLGWSVWHLAGSTLLLVKMVETDIKKMLRLHLHAIPMLMCWKFYQCHKSQPYHLLGEIREWINNPADSIKLHPGRKKKKKKRMHMLWRRCIYSQTKFYFFLCSPLTR